jgi:YVTN family beta-propeller protein
VPVRTARPAGAPPPSLRRPRFGVGSVPDAVAADPATGTVYVTNVVDNTVSVIDEATGTITATIAVDSGPDALAADPGTGTVYVANDTILDGTVSVIDTATDTITATIGVGSGPDALAVDPVTHTIYVANVSDNTVSVISAARTPTALTARIGLSPRHDLALTATLTAGGGPLSGQPVSFTTGHTHLCTRDTSTRGVATCVLTASQALQVTLHNGIVRASYPGNASYQPSSATAAPPWWWPGA